MNIEELKHYQLVYETRKQLVDRIIKAIEYIKNHDVIENNLYEQSKSELLKILGDKENE